MALCDGDPLQFRIRPVTFSLLPGSRMSIFMVRQREKCAYYGYVYFSLFNIMNGVTASGREPEISPDINIYVTARN